MKQQRTLLFVTSRDTKAIEKCLYHWMKHSVQDIIKNFQKKAEVSEILHAGTCTCSSSRHEVGSEVDRSIDDHSGSLNGMNWEVKVFF